MNKYLNLSEKHVFSFTYMPFYSVYDMVAAGKTTIIQIYSGEMEVFGEDRSGSSTPPKAMEYARDVLAEARYGPNTWGPVRLLCEED